MYVGIIILILLLMYIGCSLGYLMLIDNVPYLQNTRQLCWEIPIITIFCVICCFFIMLKKYGLIYAIKGLFIGSKIVMVGCVLSKIIYERCAENKQTRPSKVQKEIKLTPMRSYIRPYQEGVMNKLQCAA